jgi:hypothetical protein
VVFELEEVFCHRENFRIIFNEQDVSQGCLPLVVAVWGRTPA